MVKFRRPDAGQLLILSVVPTVLIYHTYIRGDPPTTLELIFVLTLYALLVFVSMIQGGVQSVDYLLGFGFLIAVFSSVLYFQNDDIVSLASIVVGILMLLRGIQLRIRKSTQPS
jgi:steroid 5-alpha reductase family enzyme